MKNEILNNTANIKSKNAGFVSGIKTIMDLSANRVSDIQIEENNGLISIKQHNSIILLPCSQIESICAQFLKIK
jgi:hypothetical protein